MKRKSCSILSTNFIFNEPGRFAAWPSIAKTSTSEMLVVFSGDRFFHIDPYGKIILCRSSDQGFSWSPPVTIDNTPLDDRDPGILETKQDTWLVTFFTSRLFADWQEQARRYYGDSAVDLWQPYIKKITPEICQKYLGTFVIRSSDRGKTWGPLIPNGGCLLIYYFILPAY
ncbi:MAG: hypothetical protein GQ536_06175 [Candidatus Aminicenantes bacterium]|nr:hypothetical protein [Candidatus Aminicenantes bacterium]